MHCTLIGSSTDWKSSNSRLCAIWAFAFTLMIWLVRLCCGPDFTHSSGIRQIENLATFLVPWVEKATSASLKRRLLRNLGHFYHQMHYANRQSRGPLCQRAAAAFRGSVQDHQVLMSQERNQHTDITHFTFIPAHSSELYMQHSGTPLLSAARVLLLCV